MRRACGFCEIEVKSAAGPGGRLGRARARSHRVDSALRQAPRARVLGGDPRELLVRVALLERVQHAPAGLSRTAVLALQKKGSFSPRWVPLEMIACKVDAE